MAYLETKRFDRAIADFNIAIALAPTCAIPYMGRANLHRRKGELEQALADVNKAISVQPQYAGGLFGWLGSSFAH